MVSQVTSSAVLVGEQRLALCGVGNTCQEAAQLVGVVVAEGGEQASLRDLEGFTGALQTGAPLVGDDDLPGPSVAGVRSACDEPVGFEVVEQVRHDGAVEVHLLGEGELGGSLARGEGDQDQVTARPSGQVFDSGGGHSAEGRGDHADAPAQVGIEPVEGGGRL